MNQNHENKYNLNIKSIIRLFKGRMEDKTTTDTEKQRLILIFRKAEECMKLGINNIGFVEEDYKLLTGIRNIKE
jgi:hypothetical protein